MNKKFIAVFSVGVMLASVFLMASASALKVGRMDWQIRSGYSRIFHPGNMDPYFPQGEGVNHWGGPSHYSPRWDWNSELCHEDNDNTLGLQLRPFNQGFNIPTFYSCSD